MHVSKLAEQRVLLQLYKKNGTAVSTQFGLSNKLAAFVPLKQSTVVADKDIQSMDITIQEQVGLLIDGVPGMAEGKHGASLQIL